MKRLRIRLVRSPIGSKPKLRRTVRALGLGRMSSTVEHEATPSILGMVRSVSHLISVEDAGESARPPRAKAESGRKPAAVRPASGPRLQPGKPAGAKPAARKPKAGGAAASGSKVKSEKPAAAKVKSEKPAAAKGKSENPAVQKPVAQMAEPEEPKE
jgi:large subunit ribosomal protein L30